MKRILTIQDISCLGQCSLTVALPIISACGVETAILPSAVLSTHTAFPNVAFRDLTEDIPAIEAHWNREKLTFDAFYTGYVTPAQIPAILHVMESTAAPGALRIIDPVMADHGRLYTGFDDTFPAQMTKLCEGADYVLPNLTEAALLLGRRPMLSGYNRDDINELGLTLRDHLHAGCVVLTGVTFDDNPDEIETAVCSDSLVCYASAPRQPRMYHGTGDIFASTFTGMLMRGYKPRQAAQIAADFVCDCIRATTEDHTYGVSFEAALPELIKKCQAPLRFS